MQRASPREMRGMVPSSVPDVCPCLATPESSFLAFILPREKCCDKRILAAVGVFANPCCTPAHQPCGRRGVGPVSSLARADAALRTSGLPCPAGSHRKAFRSEGNFSHIAILRAVHAQCCAAMNTGRPRQRMERPRPVAALANKLSEIAPMIESSGPTSRDGRSFAPVNLPAPRTD